jgi:fatty acid desaturase
MEVEMEELRILYSKKDIPWWIKFIELISSIIIPVSYIMVLLTNENIYYVVLSLSIAKSFATCHHILHGALKIGHTLRAFILLAQSCFFFYPSAWKISHPLHHLHNGTSNDPDLHLSFDYWVVVGMFIPQWFREHYLFGRNNRTGNIILTAIVNLLLPVYFGLPVYTFLKYMIPSGLLYYITVIPVHFSGNRTNDVTMYKYHDQLSNTINFCISNSRVDTFISWYVGYNNYQIEHHLFPSVHGYYLPTISKHIREICKKHGYPYYYHENIINGILWGFRNTPVLKLLSVAPLEN